jgi:glycine/betaine/sarcosine/D-proline reductase family selenoprotein B
MTPVAIMVGSNRIVPGSGVIHPVGNVDLGSNEEKNLRRTIVQKAIEALHTELKEQTVFPRPSV